MSNAGDDEDDEVRDYFRGKRDPPPVRPRDNRLRDALLEVVKIAVESLPAAERLQREPGFGDPDDHERLNVQRIDGLRRVGDPEQESMPRRNPRVPLDDAPPAQAANREDGIYQERSRGFVARYGPERQIPDRVFRREIINQLRNVREDRIRRRNFADEPPPLEIAPPLEIPEAPLSDQVLNDLVEEAGFDGNPEIDQLRLADIRNILNAVAPFLRNHANAQNNQANVQDNQLRPSHASGNPEDVRNVNEQDDHVHQSATTLVNTPAVDFPDPELEDLISEIRSDPAIHKPELRNNLAFGSRTPGETDSAFRPRRGDLVVRLRPLHNGNFLEYYTDEIPRSAPLQAGDRIIRVYIDNTTDMNCDVIYSELHTCIGNQGGQEPRFLYFGKSEERMRSFHGG